MLQQVTAEVQARLAVLVVLIERILSISHSLITSALDIWQRTFHTPVVEEIAGPPDICRPALTARFPSGVLQQLFECLPQSLPDIMYEVKTWIQSVWVPKTMPWKEHNKLIRNDAAGIVLQQHSLAVSSCIFIFHKTLVLRLSEIRPIPWFLTNEPK